LPAAVLNDEATVTDATSDAALTGGGSLTIPVWYNGTAWTKLGGGSGGGSTTVVSGAKLKNWKYKIENTPATATLAFAGDSTSDFTGNGSGLPANINAKTKIGFPLEGFNIANMPNYGTNGQTIVGFISDTGVKGLANLAAANLDLVIFSFGINDIRQNNLTKDQLKNHIITCVNTIKAGSPNTEIVLRMPNSFDIPLTNTYIQQGTYASLAEAAQAQTTILYQAYKELEFYWSDVLLFDTQNIIYGKKTISPSPSPLHTDEIHPTYFEMVDYLVDNMIGYTAPFKKELAKQSIEKSLTPWVAYPRVFELESDFVKLGEGLTGGAGANFNFFTTEKNKAYELVSNNRYGDYISIGQGRLVIKNTSTLDFSNDSRVNYPITLAGNTFPTGTKVEFFRAKFDNVIINRRYLKDTKNYPYARRVKIGFANNGNFLITQLLDDGITTPITKGITAPMLELSTSDVVVFNDGTVTPLTGATFSFFSGGRYVTKTGNFAPYLDTVAFLYGNRSYESLIKTGTATLVAGTVTISDPNVTTSSKVQVSVKTAGGTVGTYYQNTVAQGSLVITSQSNTDTSVITYTIYN
jgi:lysophospholipase L1-like esterase